MSLFKGKKKKEVEIELQGIGTDSKLPLLGLGK